MIAMILIRNLHRDIMRYNRVPTDEEKAEEREETGWKVSCTACGGDHGVGTVVASGWLLPPRREGRWLVDRLYTALGSCGTSDGPLKVAFWPSYVVLVAFLLITRTSVRMHGVAGNGRKSVDVKMATLTAQDQF